MNLVHTPNANRLHIALFGKRNSGKSSLINALTGQDTALVSDTPGTTTDPVQKAGQTGGPLALYVRIRFARYVDADRR